MYKPCPYCRKKKPHYHKPSNAGGETREFVNPQKTKKESKKND